MIQVQILEDTDVVLATDLCRPLQLVTMSGGHSDYYSFESAYSGTPENHVKWCRVEQVFGPIWFNKPVNALNKISVPYEFMRGQPPEKHLYGKTNREKLADYEEYLKCNVFQYGKHKEMTFYEVRHRYPSYFEWAVAQGIINENR